ncbi:hypothetical protein F5I97DRAFT_1965195 [Phlebopus sp. FC_14]|nr:hypothetical protein F5I97DRAFT_1965195 [Phlebopus sp. FC_14]
MDGASSATIIIQLIETGAQVLSALTQYVKSVKEAESCRLKLVEHLSLATRAAAAVQTILESSSTRSKADDVLIKDWFCDDGPQMQCKKALDGLLGDLSATINKRMSWAEKLQWPMKEKRINARIQVFERHRPYFGLVLQIDLAYKTNDIRESIDDVACKSKDIQHGVQNVSKTVNFMAGEIVAERERSKIEQIDASQRAAMKNMRDWFGAFDCTVKHESTRRLRQSETCTWLFAVQSFIDWRQSLLPFLWLNGIAGSGKSVLASAVIDEIERGLSAGETLAYFYFDFGLPRTTSAMEALRSLLVQFLHSETMNWLPVFDDFVARKDRGAAPPTDVHMLVDLLKRALKLHKRPIIVIDALDECQDREKLLMALKELNDGHAQLFCVSRPEVDIKEAFSDLPSISLSVMEGPLLEDMRRHIEAELENRRNLKKLRVDQKGEVRQLLLEKAQGMFRWVQCQLDRLDRCHSTGDIDHVLHTLPEGLFETYDRILQAIEKKEFSSGVVRRVLLWLVVAESPLTLSSLWEALKIDLTKPVLNGRIAPMREDDILETCGSLIRFNEETEVVALSHYTVKEYLTATNPQPGVHIKHVIALPEAHLQIAKLCLHYFVVYTNEFDFVRVRRNDQLLRYAVWAGRHIADIPADDDSIIPFLVAIQEHIAANQDKAQSMYDSFVYSYNGPPSLALRMIAVYGSMSLLQRYLDRYPIGSDDPGSPLILAAGLGRVDQVELLLDHGVDVNAEGEDINGEIMLPIEAAVRSGNTKIVKLFLARESRIPQRIRPRHAFRADLRGDTLLHAALELPYPDGDYLETLKVLAEAGCVPESLPCRGATLLILATTNGLFPVAEWLLDRCCQLSADFLLAAIQHSCIAPKDIIEWSLQRRVAPDSIQRDSGDNVLHALMRNHSRPDVKQAIEELIRAGCNVGILLNSENAIGKTPMHLAVECCNIALIEYLVTGGARVPANIIHSLMNITEISTFESMLRVLVQSGLDIKEASASLDSAGNTILHAICLLRMRLPSKPYLSPGERLSDCDDNIQGFAYEFLSERPLLQRAHVLQQADFDLAGLVNVQNKDGFTALRMALDCELPSPRLVSYLIDLGETFANVDHLPVTNLHWAMDLPWYGDAVDACRRAMACQSMALSGGHAFPQHISHRIATNAEPWLCASVTHHDLVFGRDTTQLLSVPELPADIRGAVVERIVFSYAGKYHEGKGPRELASTNSRLIGHYKGRAVGRRSGISRSIRRNGIVHEPFSKELELKRFSSDRCFYWIYHTTTEVFWDRRHAEGPNVFELAPGDALVLRRNAPEDAVHWERLEAELELEFYRIDIYYSLS